VILLEEKMEMIGRIKWNGRRWVHEPTGRAIEPVHESSGLWMFLFFLREDDKECVAEWDLESGWTVWKFHPEQGWQELSKLSIADVFNEFAEMLYDIAVDHGGGPRDAWKTLQRLAVPFMEWQEGLPIGRLYYLYDL